MEIIRPTIEAQLKVLSWGKEAVAKTRQARISSRFNDVIRITGANYGSLTTHESRGSLNIFSTSDNDRAFTNLMYWLPTELHRNPRKFIMSAERSALVDGYSLVQASLIEYDEVFGEITMGYKPGTVSGPESLAYSDVMGILKSASTLAKMEARQRHALTFYD
jgi:hypothetical protein